MRGPNSIVADRINNAQEWISVADRSLVFAGSEILHKLDGEATDRREQQGVNKAAFVQ
jgi:hypothetical protein